MAYSLEKQAPLQQYKLFYIYIFFVVVVRKYEKSASLLESWVQGPHTVHLNQFRMV
jgi:hypothetical protein